MSATHSFITTALCHFLPSVCACCRAPSVSSSPPAPRAVSTPNAACGTSCSRPPSPASVSRGWASAPRCPTSAATSRPTMKNGYGRYAARWNARSGSMRRHCAPVLPCCSDWKRLSARPGGRCTATTASSFPLPSRRAGAACASTALYGWETMRRCAAAWRRSWPKALPA